MIVEIITLLVLLFMSAFFSGAEIALFSLSNIKVQQHYEKHTRGSTYLKLLKDKPNRTLITILIGNNVVNITASSLATVIAVGLFGDSEVGLGVGVAVGVITLFILIFGEIVPKTVCQSHNEKISLVIAPIVYLFSKLFYPLIIILYQITKVSEKLFGVKKHAEFTESDLKQIITMGKKEGSINEMEHELINNVFKFDDTIVKDVMTPRAQMFTLNCKQKIIDSLDEVIENKFTRIPVYDGTVDHIVGVVFVKDMLETLRHQQFDKLLEDIMLDVYFVPEYKKLGKLLRQFQRRKLHMAVIVDEYGGVAGLATIEDLLEEIVGDIQDESDEEDENVIKKLNKYTYEIHGTVMIDDVNKETGLEFKHDEHVDTINGLILNELGYFPSVGQIVEIDGITFDILTAEEKHIKKVLLKIPRKFRTKKHEGI